MDKALEDAFAFEGPSVIITRWPCVLKNFTEADIKEFDLAVKKQCHVIEEACRGCRVCTKTGCPAISFDNVTKKAKIDKYMCVGCEVCLQACPFKAIERVGK
jgi:indolepyruvate ferredoxin oxidoreductase alpha subunit